MEEARHVQPGSPILASQHNALVDAVGGQLNSSPDLQFTRTGGGTIYSANNNFTDLPQSKMDALFEISYGAGELDGRYTAWDETNEDNGFRGIWLKVVNFAKNREFFYHTQFFPQLSWLVNIDPTNEDGKLIWQMPGAAEDDDAFQLPLCTADKAASMLVLLVDQLNDNASASSRAMLGCTVSIVGDWSPWLDEEEANPGEAWAAWYLHQQDLTIKLKAVCPALQEVAVFRVVAQYQLYDNFKTEVTQDWHFDPVTLNIGQQHIESMPDSLIAAPTVLSSAQLSSIEFTTAKQFGYPTGAPTFSYSLYNFEKLGSDISKLSSLKGQLSSYDVLVKHKTPNEKVAGNCKADLQYLALSTLLGTVDSEISSLHLSSIQTETWTDPDTGEDIDYHQLFGFAERGLAVLPPLTSYQDRLEVVLRDSYTTNNVGARVNYTPLSAVIAAAGGSQVLVDTQNSTLSSIDFYNGNLELRNFHLQQNETLNPQYPTQVQQYDIVLRENNGNGNAEVKYTSLSALGKNLYTTVDGELQSVGNSIRKDYDRANSTEYIGLWNFDNHTPETLEAELEYGKWKYVHLNGSGDTADAGTDFLLWNNAGGTPFLDYTDIKIRLPKPSTSDVEGLDQIISDLTGWYDQLTSDVEDLSNSLSNYWKVGGSYNDNCYGQSVGDSGKTLAIDLDSRLLADQNGDTTVDWDSKQLRLPGGDLAVDWGQCELHYLGGGGAAIDWNNSFAYDVNGNQTLQWSTKHLLGGWTADDGLAIGTGHTLTIGNTTLTEAQLQALLALI